MNIKYHSHWSVTYVRSVRCTVYSTVQGLYRQTIHQVRKSQYVTRLCRHFRNNLQVTYSVSSRRELALGNGSTQVLKNSLQEGVNVSYTGIFKFWVAANEVKRPINFFFRCFCLPSLRSCMVGVYWFGSCVSVSHFIYIEVDRALGQQYYSHYVFCAVTLTPPSHSLIAKILEYNRNVQH